MKSKKRIDTPTISLMRLAEIVNDGKPDYFTLFEQLMEEMCEADYRKYKKALKKIGEYVDEARKGYGYKQVLEWK